MLNIATRLLSEVATRAGALILFPLLARHLGAEGYGVYAQAIAINGALIPVATMGLGFSVVRLIAGTQDVAYVSSRFISTLLLVTVVSGSLALSVAAAAPFLNELFTRVPEAVSILRWSALLVVSTALNVTVAEYYRARLRIAVYAGSQIATTLATVGGSAIVLNNGGGLITVLQVMLAAQLAQFVVTTAYLAAVKEVSLRTRLMSHADFASMIKFGIPVVVTGLGTWVFASSDRLLIGMFLNASEAGVYNAAYALAGVPPAVAGPFWYAIYPLMAKYTRSGDKPTVAALCRRYSSAYFIVGIPALAGLCVIAADTLEILGSGGFTSSPLMFAMIAVALVSDQVAATSHYLIYLHNEPAYLRNITILAGILNVVLNIILLPQIGIMGAALSTLVSYLVLETLVVRKAASYGYPFGSLYEAPAVARIVTSVVFMVLVLLVTRMTFRPETIPGLIGLCAWGAAVYAVALWASYGFRISRLMAFARPRHA